MNAANQCEAHSKVKPSPGSIGVHSWLNRNWPDRWIIHSPYFKLAFLSRLSKIRRLI